LGFFEDSGQAIKEGVAVLVVSENLKGDVGSKTI